MNILRNVIFCLYSFKHYLKDDDLYLYGSFVYKTIFNLHTFTGVYSLGAVGAFAPANVKH